MADQSTNLVLDEEMDRNMLESFIKDFVARSQAILGDNLEGIYLHGSAVMGCFNEKKSDIDLVIVVNTTVPAEIKYQYMDMVVEMNPYAPEKGIELSIVKKEVCKPFIYPTPFELHFSIKHLEWYKTNPSDYINKMNGVDRDLAAHFTILYHRGKCLYGKDIKEVFEKVGTEFYFDSIWNDVKNAEEEIMRNPTYMILNLCRVLAYQKDALILSKQEGGNWGLANIPPQYHSLILQALEEYSSDKLLKWDENNAYDYVTYMINQIKNKMSE